MKRTYRKEACLNAFVCVYTVQTCLLDCFRGLMYVFHVCIHEPACLNPPSHPPPSPLPRVDHRPPHAARGLPAQRGVHPHAPHGRAPHRRTDAVQSRRETLPRPLLRQQAQLVSVWRIETAAGAYKGEPVSLSVS